MFSKTSRRIREWCQWVHPSDDQLYNAGDYADVWSSDDGGYLNVNTDGGNVNRDDDRQFGRSVRLLNTMHLSDIFQAYFDCRRRKRRTLEALLWEENFERNCIQLHRKIISGSYTPDSYKLIYVTDPVMREIFVPTFRDRVVHHLLANWLRPKLEKLFIYDNYAGREGRGTLFGIRRAEGFMRQVTHNYQKPAYVLKLDIASYFRSIPKEVLWQKIQKIVNYAPLGKGESKGDCEKNNLSQEKRTRNDSIITILRPADTSPLDFSTFVTQSEIHSLFPFHKEATQRERERVLMNLLKTVIFHDPRTHFSGKIDSNFPQHKSLFSAPKDKGLPLGDLVSQLLGNFYLHTLDHFVKHILHMKYYGRYMDDMIFFHSDREVLENVIHEVRIFLGDRLGLTLHEGKIILNTGEQGILFLGAYIKPWRTYIGNRTKKNMHACIAARIEDKFEQQMCSYFGLLGHVQTYRLRRHLRKLI